MLKAIMASRAFPTARGRYPPTVHRYSEAQGARKQGHVTQESQESQVKRKALTVPINGCPYTKGMQLFKQPPELLQRV